MFIGSIRNPMQKFGDGSFFFIFWPLLPAWISDRVTQTQKLIETINEERKRNDEYMKKLIESLNEEQEINEKLSNMVDEERTYRKQCKKKMGDKLEEVNKGMKTLSENVKSIGNLVSQLHKESRNQNYKVSHAIKKN